MPACVPHALDAQDDPNAQYTSADECSEYTQMTISSDPSTPPTEGLPAWWDDFADALRRSGGTVVALTGAGLSAESGLPTFRGTEGYWTVNSREYTPQQMATWSTFAAAPDEVWRWYLYRARQYRVAEPNEGHRILARWEALLGDRFHLVTQNVDGLHARAGSSPERTSAIHGDLGWMRCSRECGVERWRVPAELTDRTPCRDAMLDERERSCLRCPACGSWARPHVLWFDECYDDRNYDATRALTKARDAAILVVIGTSGATNLPLTAARECLRAGGRVMEINLCPTPFTRLAKQSSGRQLTGPATRWLPELLKPFDQRPPGAAEHTPD